MTKDRERREDMHTYVYVKDWGCSRVIIQWNHTVETVIALRIGDAVEL